MLYRLVVQFTYIYFHLFIGVSIGKKLLLQNLLISNSLNVSYVIFYGKYVTLNVNGRFVCRMRGLFKRSEKYN